MRSIRHCVWLIAVVGIIVFNLVVPSAAADPLSGTRSVGPTGDYPSITAALADIQVQTLSGPLVLELQPAYLCNVETFPIVFSNLPTTAVNTLTLRPQFGAANLLITNFTSPTVDLNGVQFVTIDGRPGGVGSNAGSGVGAASQLTIANTYTGGVALSLESATNNTIAYTTFKGVSAYDFDAVIRFAYGNVHNTMDHCDIRDGDSAPVNGIIDGNLCENDIISNCNIYNFYSYGILLNAGTGWIITGNSFYQRVERAVGGGTVGAININIFNPVTNNFVITSNSIGGSGPNAVATAWSIFGISADFRFVGIALNVGSTVPTSVQGNVIKNFYWFASSGSSSVYSVWNGITISKGSANIGTEAGNIIGDTNVNSIHILASGVTNVSTGISSTSTNKVVIANNVVSSIQVVAKNFNDRPSLIGIAVTGGVNIISNNLVGSSNVLSALSVTNAYAAYGGMLDGISSSSSNSNVIAGNLVANLNNMHAGSGGGFVRGIVVTNGVNTVWGNTVRNLTTSSTFAPGGASSAALGISVSSAKPGQTISQNTVHSLFSTSISGLPWVTGIHFSGSGGSSVISQNLVHSLEVSSTNTASRLAGFSFSGGNFTARNNIARVGLAANGTSTANDSLVWGILDNSSTPGRNFYHNSVYLGGTQDSLSTNYTAAFFCNGSNARTLENNILVNARNNSGGTNSHYAIYHNSADLTGLTSDANLLLASGTGGVLIEFATNNYLTLTEWQSVSGQDASSLAADPLFLNPAGDVTSVDLHIATNSPAIHGGLPIGVAADFDGDPRSPTAPTIGADELFDYTLVPGYNLLTAQWLGTGGTGTGAIGFQGAPGSNYALEIATNLTPPVLWQPLATNNAGTNGSLIFTNLAIQSPVFFRTRNVP